MVDGTPSGMVSVEAELYDSVGSVTSFLFMEDFPDTVNGIEQEPHLSPGGTLPVISNGRALILHFYLKETNIWNGSEQRTRNYTRI